MSHEPPLNPVDEFNTLLHLARGNFARGAFQAAYHLLEAALHSAVELKDPERITSAVALANEIGAWLDTNAPEHPLSSHTAEAKGQLSLFSAYVHKGGSMRLALQTDQGRAAFLL